MVLPKATATRNGSSKPSATPDRPSLYEAGKGHILSHFAGIATPDVSAAAVAARAPTGGGTRLRTRRSLDGLNGDLPPLSESDLYGKSDMLMASSSLVSTINDDYSSGNYTNFVSTTDRDMEDALFGTHSTGDNNNRDDDEVEGKELSQKDKLDMWRRSKERGSGAGNNRIPMHPNSKSHAVQQQPSKRPKAAHAQPKPVAPISRSAFDESNQSFESEASQMFTMDFSPPRHNRSAPGGAISSRRSTIEVDPSAAAIALASENYDKSKQQQQQQQSNGSDSKSSKSSKSWKENSSFSGSFVSNEPFSPAMSTEFLSRDLEEEERALRAKSDKDRAYLYKKRYIDTYGFTVALARRVMRLETQRADRSSEIDVLRSKVRTQEQIIRAMSQNEVVNMPGETNQEKQIQSLCREVGALVQQLGERDSIIKNLHDERDESVRAMNEIKLSHAACQAGDCDHQQQTSNEFAAAIAPSQDAEIRELQHAVETKSRETNALKDQVATINTKCEELTSDKDILEDELVTMKYKFDDIQHLYEASESQREALSTGLQQAEEQLGKLHAQWTQEKKELLSSASYDEKKAAGLAAECEQLRRENAALRSSLRTTSESEKKLVSVAEVQRTTVQEKQEYIARLESELQQMHNTIRSMSEREKLFVRVEFELSTTKQELGSKVSRIGALEQELQAKDDELRNAEHRFKEKSIFMEKRLFQAEIVRRSLHNKVMELKGNIRVFCRVRPVLRHELSASGNEEIFTFPDYDGERRQIELAASSKSHVSYGQNSGREAVKKYNFDFDLVFDSTCSQEDVFLEVSALVQSALDGYNVCIFAYGQTGSGKTFTMQGRENSAGYETMQPSSHMGIVGRAIAHIYATIADLKSSGWDFSVSLEMIEIYNETLRDLLAPTGSLEKVDLRLDADGKPAIANSCIHTVANELDAWQMLRKAMAKRSTKATSMNDRSSRSHCVITFRMNGVNSLTGDRRLGVVHLVDLAGSERLKSSGSGNDRELLKEAQAINKSLSSLGNVICALAKKSAHVPFRDSKLTHFLSPSLGGDSKTLMICNLSPLKQHRDETLNSLRFAKTVNSCEIAYPSISNRS